MTRLVALVVLIAGCHQTSEHSAQPDAMADASPACTSSPTGMCSPSEYCGETEVGALLPAPGTGCTTLPAACAATPTCACLLANLTCSGGGGPGCTDDDASQLVFTCVYP